MEQLDLLDFDTATEIGGFWLTQAKRTYCNYMYY